MYIDILGILFEAGVLVVIALARLTVQPTTANCSNSGSLSRGGGPDRLVSY